MAKSCLDSKRRFSTQSCGLKKMYLEYAHTELFEAKKTLRNRFYNLFSLRF